jgi:hypothetical protein
MLSSLPQLGMDSARNLFTAPCDITQQTLTQPLILSQEMLPFFLTPSSSLSMYAAAALHTLNTRESAAASQVLSLKYAVRWNLGIPDFDASVYDTNRWLMWAAGSVSDSFTDTSMISQLWIE